MTKIIRPILICGDVAYVPLTQGYEAIIDAADVPLVCGFNWHACPAPGTLYANRTDYSKNNQVTVAMHRIIMSQPKGLMIDHQDGNGLNNRRNNLRLATSSQNNCNSRIRIDNTSGLKGIFLVKKTGKWRARITVNKKENHLGYFLSKKEAYAAYCAASDKYHGEFGRTE